MASHFIQKQNAPEHTNSEDLHSTVDYLWFAKRFDKLQERLTSLEDALTAIEQNASVADQTNTQPPMPREYFSVPEFASQVDRTIYTVREWCRLGRILAEKCESGRGDAKIWKIPTDELQRYRDHGLQPSIYLR